MTILIEGEKKLTTLQVGDTCQLIAKHGTVCFRRGAEVMRRIDGDDKFLVKPINALSFSEIVAICAEATGLKAELAEPDLLARGIITYRFV